MNFKKYLQNVGVNENLNYDLKMEGDRLVADLHKLLMDTNKNSKDTTFSLKALEVLTKARTDLEKLGRKFL